MLSVHRIKINSDKEKFIENALTQFGRECPRRLKFIFNEKDECIIIISNYNVLIIIMMKYNNIL
jgi:hypothetical protein